MPRVERYGSQTPRAKKLIVIGAAGLVLTTSLLADYRKGFSVGTIERDGCTTKNSIVYLSTRENSITDLKMPDTKPVTFSGVGGRLNVHDPINATIIKKGDWYKDPPEEDYSVNSGLTVVFTASDGRQVDVKGVVLTENMQLEVEVVEKVCMTSTSPSLNSG